MCVGVLFVFSLRRRPPAYTLTASHLPYPTLGRPHEARRVGRPGIAQSQARAQHQQRNHGQQPKLAVLARLQHGSDGSRATCRKTVAAASPEIVTGSCPFDNPRSEEHTSELQSLMRISSAVFCLKTKKTTHCDIDTL